MSMDNFPGNEHVFPSTTTAWKYVKIARPPEATQPARRRRSFHGLSLWNRRIPLTIKITYRGGSECWYEIHARGAVIRTVGSCSVHDLMELIYGRA